MKLWSPPDAPEVILGFGVPYLNIVFSERNHYEIKVYTFFSMVT